MKLVALCSLAFALAALGGCSDAVDPTLGTDQAFSLYGYLDPTADRQALRVVPITPTLEGDSAAVLDVAVTSTEPATGRTATWRDSAVTYVDGSRGHVFVADYTPTAGATVEIRVQDRTGSEQGAVVTVDVPALARPEIGLATSSVNDVLFPIQIVAPRVIATQLVYRVVGWPGAPTDTVAVPFRDVAPLADAGGGRWALDLAFLKASRVFLASPEARGAQLKLVQVEARVFVANDAWAIPPGGLDLDAIIEPGTFSNVTGGFGFVGTGYWTSARWVPSLATQSRAGFVTEGDPTSLLVFNEANVEGWVELFNPTRETISIGGYMVASGPDTTAFPLHTFVEAGEIRLVHMESRLSGASVSLNSPNGTPVFSLDLRRLPKEARYSYGSYPDGRSHEVNTPGGPPTDIFRGVLRPTPNQPNQLLSRTLFVNEISSAGPDGWAEIFFLPPLGFQGAWVSTDPTLPIREWIPISASDGRLVVADETDGRLDLEQVGGEVYVLTSVLEEGLRVVDARPFGPQEQDRSSGYLFDGVRSVWRTDLIPTRGAPNAAARFTSF